MRNQLKTIKKSFDFSRFFVTFLLIFLLAGCGVSGGNQKAFTKQAFYLDTLVSITYYDTADEAAAAKALALCADYEKVFSRTDPESELHAVNAAAGSPVVLSDDLTAVIAKAIEISERSGGRFDITLGRASALYGFSESSPSAPDDAALAAAMAHSGMDKISLTGNTLTVSDPETVLDLGAIAKGYIADRLRESLLENGVKHAIIDLGGNILCFGGKPDGSDYCIGIQYPEKDSAKVITAVNAQELSVVTSGVYQRFFEENGVTYHHILDAGTGRPADTGLLAVSITCTESLTADALSTAVFVMGPDDGMALVNATEGVEAVFITNDRELHYSEGFDPVS